MVKIIAVIPARGGSKGIPRKNLRLLDGKPLIAYSIEAAQCSKNIDKVVVSTEDAEIKEFARLYGAEVVERPPELSDDEITLDPVIKQAVQNYEDYDYIVTIQPTSPLLSSKTLDSAISEMKKSSCDTLISVVDETHLYWTNRGTGPEPIYRKRENRQYLDPIYKETGALMISKRGAVIEGSRIGKDVRLFEIPRGEGIDIDNYSDWIVAEALLKKLKIVFRVDGDKLMGLGHVYRALTLCNRIFGHDVHFLMDGSKELGIRKVKENNYKVITFKTQDDERMSISKIRPDIVIVDILDTDVEYIRYLKSLGSFVVNFEDLGEGSKYADLVINSLYENASPPTNHYYGHNYVCLRDEFYLWPFKEVGNEVKNILITFGGTDPNNLTLKTVKALVNLGRKDISIRIVLGLGYSPKRELKSFIDEKSKEGFDIEIYENVKFMSRFIFNADIVVTSNGRTVYEVASIGTPCISIPQNERETNHLFAKDCKGVIDLDIFNKLSDVEIGNAISSLIDDVKRRRYLRKKMSEYDLRGGTERVIRLIFDKYELNGT